MSVVEITLSWNFFLNICQVEIKFVLVLRPTLKTDVLRAQKGNVTNEIETRLEGVKEEVE